MSDGYDFFQIPPNSERYPGRKRCTLPFQMGKDFKEARQNNKLIVSKFETIEDLQKLRNSKRKV